MSSDSLVDNLVNEIVEAVNAKHTSLDDLSRLLDKTKKFMAGAYFKQQPDERQQIVEHAKKDLEEKIDDLSPASPQRKDFPQERSGQQPIPEVNHAVIEPEKQRREYSSVESRGIHYQHQAEIMFGRAQSALRLMNYERARALFEEAKQLLDRSDSKINKEWRDFENELIQAEEAQFSYEQGMEAFSQGNLDEAINKIQLASDLAGFPSYREKVAQLREIQSKISQIRQKVFTHPLDLDKFLPAKRELDEMQAQYPGNKTFSMLRKQFEPTLAQARTMVVQQAKEDLEKITQAQSMVDANKWLDHAKRKARTSQELSVDNTFSINQVTLSRDIDEAEERLRKLQNTYQEAGKAYNERRFSKALDLVRKLQETYPHDEKVKKLDQDLTLFRTLRRLFIGMLVLVGIFVIAVLVNLGIRGYEGYVQNREPTSTFTPTYTFSLIKPSLTPVDTFTPKPPLTATATTTETSTPTFTPTFAPTPTISPLVTVREIEARLGCYDGFESSGRIPAYVEVHIIPTERRLFDHIGRECVIVEYPVSLPVIGWVLLEDLTRVP